MRISPFQNFVFVYQKIMHDDKQKWLYGIFYHFYFLT
jgi:hypothetical protein